MSKNSIIEYMKNKNFVEKNMFGIQVIVKDPIETKTENFNLESVFQKVKYTLPDSFIDLIDAVYIGNFEFLTSKNVNAIFTDDTLYILNVQDDEEDLLDDIIHEIAHAVEDRYGQYIYEDDSIEKEFIFKRDKLKNRLKTYNYDVSNQDFYNLEYTEQFDKFLYEDIGYDSLHVMFADVFINPYSITSFREYFATAFEEYFLGDRNLTKRICPYVYNKINLLIEKINKGDI